MDGWKLAKVKANLKKTTTTTTTTIDGQNSKDTISPDWFLLSGQCQYPYIDPPPPPVWIISNPPLRSPPLPSPPLNLNLSPRVLDPRITKS